MADIDAITLVEQDHNRIRKMFEELMAVDDDADARRALFDDITTLIEAHSEMETQVFYPAVRDAVGGPEAELLFHRSNLEHELVDRVIEQATDKDASSMEFLAICEVVRDNLEDHMELEEELLLPRAREALRSEQLSKLTEQMEEVKEARLRQVAKELVKDLGEVPAPGA
jgi:hemerythrin superfamily protein